MGKSWIDRKCTGMGNPHGSLPCGTLRGPSASSQLQCPSENAPKVLLNQKLSYFLFWVLGWVPKNWCFWTVVLEKTFESPLGRKRSNQSILNEISPDYSLEWETVFILKKLYEMQISLHCLMFIAGKDMARPTLQGGRVGIVKWWLFWKTYW